MVSKLMINEDKAIYPMLGQIKPEFRHIWPNTTYQTSCKSAF